MESAFCELFIVDRTVLVLTLRCIYMFM